MSGVGVWRPGPQGGDDYTPKPAFDTYRTLIAELSA